MNTGMRKEREKKMEVTKKEKKMRKKAYKKLSEKQEDHGNF